MKKRKLVVLSGAGISAESGLQTFRDADGLWENHRIEDVATPEAFEQNPKLVLDFYNARRKAASAAQPNAAHFGIVDLENHFEVTVVTQNVDDLHERAGSTNVYHLHGELKKMRSTKNEGLSYPIDGDIHLGDLAEDGAQLRPDIVWFGEMVPMIEQVLPIVQEADIFVIFGTSLLVYPAAGLANEAPYGIPVYIIDKKIPKTKLPSNFIKIELPATQGISLLKENLLNNK